MMSHGIHIRQKTFFTVLVATPGSTLKAPKTQGTVTDVAIILQLFGKSELQRKEVAVEANTRKIGESGAKVEAIE